MVSNNYLKPGVTVWFFKPLTTECSQGIVVDTYNDERGILYADVAYVKKPKSNITIMELDLSIQDLYETKEALLKNEIDM